MPPDDSNQKWNVVPMRWVRPNGEMQGWIDVEPVGASGLLGVHQNVGELRLWNVAHIPSGGIVVYAPSRKEAVVAAEQLDYFLDTDRANTADPKAAVAAFDPCIYPLIHAQREGAWAAACPEDEECYGG